MKQFYGLIGKSLNHSFSKDYFLKKIKEANINAQYSNFEIDDISKIREVVIKNNLNGFNVTIPFKETIIPFLDELSSQAKEIGAVNTVNVKDGRLIGYNTDYIGFANSIKPHLHQKHERALILGTGGASKAISYVLDNLGISYLYATQSKKGEKYFSYEEINNHLLKFHLFIINTSPVGTFPNKKEKPLIDYSGITKDHFLYDLVYNPSQTAFMKEGVKKDAFVMNGYDMLKIQAEESYKIWIK